MEDRARRARAVVEEEARDSREDGKEEEADEENWEEIVPVTQRLEVTHSRGRFLLATPDPLCAVRCVLSCQRNRGQTNAVWELTATVAH